MYEYDEGGPEPPLEDIEFCVRLKSASNLDPKVEGEGMRQTIRTINLASCGPGVHHW